MRKVLLTLLFLANCIFANTYSELMEELNNLSQEQRKVMNKVYRYGKNNDLQWSLTAIAWKESFFGKYKMPLGKDTLDRGTMQVNLKSYFKRYGIKDTKKNRRIYGDKLIKDDKHNMDAAIEELRFWEKQKKSWQSYRRVWSQYNDGTIVTSKGENYGKDIALRVRVLRDFLDS